MLLSCVNLVLQSILLASLLAIESRLYWLPMAFGCYSLGYLGHGLARRLDRPEVPAGQQWSDTSTPSRR